MWEWLYFLPKVMPFPQTSHLAIKILPPLFCIHSVIIPKKREEGQEAGINISL